MSDDNCRSCGYDYSDFFLLLLITFLVLVISLNVHNSKVHLKEIREHLEKQEASK